MKEYTKPYKRLSELLTLLMSEKYSETDGKPKLTINLIGKITGIPESVLRDDLMRLLEDSYIHDCFIIEGIDADASCDRVVILLEMLKKRSMHLENVKIGLSPQEFFKDEKFSDFVVMLSPVEKNIFAKVSHLSGISEAVWIKDTVFAPTQRELEIRDEIHSAIKDGKQISFYYGDKQIDSFNPVKIYENMEDKMLYCLGYGTDLELELKRLDKIKELKVSDESIVLSDNLSEVLEKMEYTWGGDMPEGDIYHVKLKIFKDTVNILDKIRVETNNRKHRRIYEDEENEDIAYYEDYVCGSGSLKKWLRKYGASVVVTEPEWLANEMYESALRRLKVYEDIIGE